MMLSPLHKMALRARALLNDCRGVVAVEFAVIVPVMLVMYFGMEEFASALAVNCKVTLVARTLSDLTSQSPSVSDNDLKNFGQTAKAILTPYDPSILKAWITEVYIDPATHVARVKWSKALTIDRLGNVTIADPSPAKPSVVPIVDELKIDGTYLIWSEVSYKYMPTIGYVMAKAGVDLTDFAYTRPRQSLCVIYPTPTSGALPGCT